jgi:hypothetical protein
LLATSQILRCALSRRRGSEVGSRKKSTIPRFCGSCMQATRTKDGCVHVVAKTKPLLLLLHSLTTRYRYLSCLCVSGHPDRNSTQRLRHVLALGRSTKHCSRPRPPSRIMQCRAAIQLRHCCPTTEVFCFMTKKSKYLKNLATDNRVIAHAPKSEIFHIS